MANANNQNEELRRRNKDAAHQSAFHWISLTNKRVLEVNKQLLSLATVLLPLTGSIAAIQSRMDIGKSGRLLLIEGWSLLFASIIAGFIQLVIEISFLKRWAEYESKRESTFSNPNLPLENMEKDAQNLPIPSKSSSHIPLIFQAVSLFVGLVLIMLVALRLLFQPETRECKFPPIRCSAVSEENSENWHPHVLEGGGVRKCGNKCQDRNNER